jgi:colanic acid/amylovoran biosynthesis glycosyltransferase
LIYFKLKSFPQVPETFIVSNLVYAKQNGLPIKIFVRRYLGITNSSQQQLLKDYNIQDDVVKPYHFSSNQLVKFFQVIGALLSFKIFWYCYIYYKLKRKKNLQPLADLCQYKHFKTGLVHVHFNNALEPLVSLAKIGYINPKCIITFHGYDAFSENRNSFQKKYGEFYKKHVFAVTVNSNYLKDEVLKLEVDPSKIRVIPIGIDTSIFKGQPKQRLQNNRIKLLTVGRLVQLKGQVYTIRAVSKLIQKGYNVEYYIIGDGNHEKTLKAEAKKLDITKHVFFEGTKQQVTIIDYMHKSDLFLMPSTYDDITKRREAFGLVSVEAQAMGLPVIGFNSGGFPDTIQEGKTGYAVKDRDHIALADKIEELIINPSLYQDMSKAAISHAQSFDFKQTTQQYIDLYGKFI